MASKSLSTQNLDLVEGPVGCSDNLLEGGALMNERLLDVKRQVKERYKALPGIVGFGIGDGTVRVYFESELSKDQVPDSFKGFKLEKVIATKPKLFSSV
jgi:hypothetical protein